MSIVEKAKQKVKNANFGFPAIHLEKKNDNPSNGERMMDLLKDISEKTTEMKKDQDDFKKDHEDYKKKNDARLDRISKKGGADPLDDDSLRRADDDLDDGEKKQLEKKSEIEILKQQLHDMELKLDRPPLGAPVSEKKTNADVLEYKAAFNHFAKTGENTYKGKSLNELSIKAMSAGSDPDGGFVVLAEEEGSILDKVMVELSPMRQLATVRKTGNAVYKKPFGLGGTASGWVGETENRATTATSQLAELDYTIMELYANPKATQTILDDASFDIESWITDEVEETFAEQESQAFVLGDGVKKPKGFLAGGYVHQAQGTWTDTTTTGLEYIGSGVDGDLPAADPMDRFIDLIYMVKAGHRKASSFGMSNLTLAKVRKIKDGQGNYLWQPSSQAGEPSSLLNYPTHEIHDMPDLASDSFSIAFGNFKRAYLIVDRFGVRVIRDPFSEKPYIQFYTTKRVGGGLQNFECLKLMKMAV